MLTEIYSLPKIEHFPLGMEKGLCVEKHMNCSGKQCQKDFFTTRGSGFRQIFRSEDLQNHLWKITVAGIEINPSRTSQKYIRAITYHCSRKFCRKNNVGKLRMSAIKLIIVESVCFANIIDR
uniref:Uncharacterized protein n=1 Tax=Spongospora subterranea TaxID=70186 RepID=A0A0H5QGR9_9EUKA|eukprot:CRZ00782.1 hypothetical protein [Spongospora subterranea]